MLFDEPEPAPQLLDLLPGREDPLLEDAILSLEQADPLPGLPQLGSAMTLPLALGQVLFGLETALPPGGQLVLERLEQALQLGQRGLIRSRVR